MAKIKKERFVKAIRGKVIIALLLACFALLMAWVVSKVAFKEMLNTVENISTPSERLRVVNVISRRIGTLDQLQKRQAFNDPKNYPKLFKESRQLRAVLDTLGFLYADDSIQLVRISKIKKLLIERDKQFINYLAVREKLVNNKAFSEQVKELNDIVSRNNVQPDSTILATEEKTSTTTIYPTEEKSRNFLSKLFGRRKTVSDNSFKIINEEKIKRDTIALSAEDKLVKSLEQSLRVIEKEQRQKNASFLNREAVLANANSMLINQMMDVLRKVESEVVNQIELNGIQAKRVMNTSISTIGIIMLVFLLLTGILLYLILIDITRSNRYRNQLEVARDEAEYHGQAKQRFLSNMSHEIRTPLQSIIGYAALIKEQENPKRSDIGAIYNSSEHLLQIVNEVLDYNRIISGKFTFSNQVFDIGQVLDEVVSVMRLQADIKSLIMQSDFDLGGIKYIVGDPFRLKQILYNLLGNAIKFTNTGNITLSAFYKRRAEQLHFTFTVQDTGIGLSDEEVKRIFNEFEQADAPGNDIPKVSGTGLGLAIVKSLVENQGGRLYVKSKKEVGSVFTVYLTFTIATELEVAQVQHLEKITEPTDKVWIVDDDQLILDLCELIFKKNGISCKTFNTPFHLLNANWDDAVNYVLMDMRMPEMNGIELCRRLREKIGIGVRIYAITAQVLPDERELLLKNGFDGLVMKPFKEDELLAVFRGDQQLVAETGTVDFLHQENDAPDLTILKKMTFGDDEQLVKILSRFKEDCINDAAEMETAIEQNDVDLILLLAHRLAGRIAQIGSKNLAGSFRVFEFNLRKQNNFGDMEKANLFLLLQRLEKMYYSIS